MPVSGKSSIAGKTTFALVVSLSIARNALGQWSATVLEQSPLSRSQINCVLPGSQGGFGLIGSAQHAVLWSGSPSSWFDLTPGATGFSAVTAMVPGQQVGYIGPHAALWTGTPQSLVDLNVAGNVISGIGATNGFEQVGSVTQTVSSAPRAYLWHGTVASATSLHPIGAVGSSAVALADGHEGGWITVSGGSLYHAALWSGSASSFVDMNLGFAESQIRGMAAGQQVGWAREAGSSQHAAMWHGSPASWMDMNPPGAGTSVLNASSGSAQVGAANLGGFYGDAGIWFGTPDSFVNLGSFLPSGMFFQSVATSVTELNGVFYVGGYASLASTGDNQAILWVGVPAPGASAIALLGLLMGARRRRDHVIHSDSRGSSHLARG